VVSHDRYFLNRVCTNILAFEGDGKIAHSVGDYDYYLEKKERAAKEAARQSAAFLSASKFTSPAQTTKAGAKPRKLSFKEQRELDGIEDQIHAVEAEVTRIEGLFAQPDFFRKHALQVNQFTADLDAAKASVTQLYARWEELEKIRTAAEKV